MSRTYVMKSKDGGRDIEQAIADGKVEGCTLHFEPYSESDDALNFGPHGTSAWPVAVTDGKNYGWFEDEMILFWGANIEIPILKALQKAGFKILKEF